MGAGESVRLVTDPCTDRNGFCFDEFGVATHERLDSICDIYADSGGYVHSKCSKCCDIIYCEGLEEFEKCDNERCYEC